MTIANKLIRAKEDYDEVYEAGKQAEYDAFWDAYQNNGNRTQYHNAFAGHGWKYQTLRPKYDIRPTRADNMFYAIGYTFDLVQVCEEQGIVLDFSKCSNFNYMANWSSITHFGVIDTRAATELPYTFTNAQSLHTIDKLIIGDNTGESTKFRSDTFTNCNKLQNITIEGEIRSSLNMKSCPLSLESAKNIILHLKDCRDNGDYSLTLTLSDATWALLDADIGYDVNGDGSSYIPWRDYVTMNICWNI